MTGPTVFFGAFLGLWAAVAVPIAAWSGWDALRRKQPGWTIVAWALVAASAGLAAAHLAGVGPAATPALALVPLSAVAIAYPVRNHRRPLFRLWVTTVWLGIFVLLTAVVMAADLDQSWVTENWAFIVAGVTWTLVITVGAAILAVILALLGALGRLSKNPIAFGVSGFYTSFFRGTPLIVQLFLWYLALPQVVHGLTDDRRIWALFTLEAMTVGIVGIGLNYGAYMTEIFRAGILSVSHGQREAAEALGMTYPQVMRRVVLPQAMRVIIPPTANDFIAMMKDTALVSFLGTSVATMEIFRRANLLGKADFKNLEALVVAAAVYWLLTAVLTFFQVRLERRVGKGHIRSVATGGATLTIVDGEADA